MKCLKPVTIRNPSDKVGIDWDEPTHIQVPCGKCYNCQANKRRQWSFRLWTEFTNSPSSAFITLTYSDETLPENGSLVKSDFQNFMKRLRKNYRLVDDRSIKYFACGEYGPTTLRPHYHALLFGLPIPSNGDYLEVWRQRILDTWNKGHITIETVNGNRIGYCTKYILKSQDAKGLYEKYNMIPPFMLCSKKPSIGSSYLDLIDIDRILDGNCRLHRMGQSVVIPEYYRRKLPDDVRERLSKDIKSYMLRHKPDYTQLLLPSLISQHKTEVYKANEKLKLIKKKNIL